MTQWGKSRVIIQLVGGCMKNPWIWQGLNGDIATSLVIGGLDFGHFIFLPNLFLRGFRGFLNWDTQKNKWLLFAESNGKMGYLNFEKQRFGMMTPMTIILGMVWPIR